MIKLYQFPTVWGLPNASPFCAKLETYLRMAKLPFEIIFVRDPRKGPKGKLPNIDDEGVRLADSGLIIKYLQKKYGDPLDQDLTPEQKAQACALRRLIEEHLYWVMIYSRWLDPSFWPTTKETFFNKMKAPMRWLAPVFVQRKVWRDIVGQGLGRHTRDEIYQFGIDDLNVMRLTLGDKDYFLGEKPSSLDATTYGFLINILEPPIPSPLQEYVKSIPQLVGYCSRMKAIYYP